MDVAEDNEADSGHQVAGRDPAAWSITVYRAVPRTTKLVIKLEPEKELDMVESSTTIESRRKAQLKAAADAYFQGLAGKDMSAVPWDENVTFRGPLAPGGSERPLQGRKAVLEWFASIYPALGEIRTIEYYINEDLTAVAVRADVGITSPTGTLRVVDRFTVDARGQITRQENHYDPRPALASS
jgi:hypothetical protein